jgi:uncharacterized protein YecE (DUF72 family)
MTFYRPVSEKTLLTWKSVVLDDFAFTMKAGEIITHIRRLQNCKTELRDMWAQFAPRQKILKLDPIRNQNILKTKGVRSPRPISIQRRTTAEPLFFAE